jgi:hypothetical protein
LFSLQVTNVGSSHGGHNLEVVDQLSSMHGSGPYLLREQSGLSSQYVRVWVLPPEGSAGEVGFLSHLSRGSMSSGSTRTNAELRWDSDAGAFRMLCWGILSAPQSRLFQTSLDGGFRLVELWTEGINRIIGTCAFAVDGVERGRLQTNFSDRSVDQIVLGEASADVSWRGTIRFDDILGNESPVASRVELESLGKRLTPQTCAPVNFIFRSSFSAEPAPLGLEMPYRIEVDGGVLFPLDAGCAATGSRRIQASAPARAESVTYLVRPETTPFIELAFRPDYIVGTEARLVVVLDASVGELDASVPTDDSKDLRDASVAGREPNSDRTVVTFVPSGCACHSGSFGWASVAGLLISRWTFLARRSRKNGRTSARLD